jgi:hypothetical protein
MTTNIASFDTKQSRASFPNRHSPNILCEGLGRMAQLTEASSSFEAINADTQPIADSSWKEHHVLLKTARTGGDECQCPLCLLKGSKVQFDVQLLIYPTHKQKELRESRMG